MGTMPFEVPPAWIPTKGSLPCFKCFGFHTGKKLKYRLNDGTEHEGIYQGWGMFGLDSREDVSHWMPADTTATDRDVHEHDHDSDTPAV
jgi:hypothetical protein